MTQAQALDILKTGASVFLTGEPGAGKTYTINEYIAYLRAHGIEPAITASTGIAATHIHGQTIHSWSGIGIRSSLSSYDLDHIASTEYVVRRVQKTTVLIIDEVSMIDAATLDMVDQVCRTIKQTSEVFGGMQVILVGDFFQLPPVARGASFAFSAASWKALRPVSCYLTEQHRQAHDSYHELLRAIRRRVFDTEHIRALEGRRIDESEIHTHGDTVTKLFSHNADVDAINAMELARLPGIASVYTMSTKGKDALVASLQKGCLSPERLELKLGAVVMCTKNNPQKGYVNGTLGQVIGFEHGTRFPIIQTRDGDRITIESAEWVIEENGKQKASIVQLPLRLAWAITIHKSQGMSMDAALMDLREVFEYGQGYVALSRVKSLDGLYLLGWNNRVFELHPQVQIEDEAFMRASDAAEVLFGDIPKEELRTMHERFILASGGVVIPTKKAKKEKVGTVEQTLMMILQGKSIAQIAKERGMTPATIYGHLEKLVESKKVAYEDIEYLFDDKLQRNVSRIRDVFVALDTSKLTPVHEHFKGAFTYDQIRLARMMMALDAHS